MIRGTCQFCGEEHLIADGKNRTVIAQAAQCVTRRFIGDDRSDPWPDWRNIAELFSAYYHKHKTCTGYNLHVVIDDGNIEDESVHWTRGYCDALKDEDGACLMTLLGLLPMVDRARISSVVGGRDGQPLREDWRPE